jgi:hypothetical protein
MMSARGEIETLLPFVSGKAAAFESEISVSGSNTRLRLVAAASLFRVPRALRAILLLADAKLSLEARTICRTLVELAIESCWMGTDEQRASLVWNRFVADQHRGLIRFGEFTRMMQPVSQTDRKQLRAIPQPPSLPDCADSAIDTQQFRAKSVARALYHLHYDPLSAGAHGDLRDAVTIVQWSNEEVLIDEAFEIASFASVALLCAASSQLGFSQDVDEFFNRQGVRKPFSSP